MSRRWSHAASFETTLRVFAASTSGANPPLPGSLDEFPSLARHRPQPHRATTELLTPPSSPSPDGDHQSNGRMGAQQRHAPSSRPLSLAPSSTSPPRLFPTFDDFLPALRTAELSEFEFPARFEPFFDPPSPSDSDCSFPAFAFSDSSSDSPWCSTRSSRSHALPPTPPRTPVQQHLSPPELALIASLHSGRLPLPSQTSPPSSPDGPIINSGNSGPMLVQDGDWKCGACGFVNWRRRKICIRCFPFVSSDDGMERSVQRAWALASSPGPTLRTPYDRGHPVRAMGRAERTQLGLGWTGRRVLVLPPLWT